MSPAFENPNKLNIPPEITQVLTAMFAGYRRVILRKEFGYGLSGSRVIEVRPIQADGVPELPVVVKAATISLIQKEWQAYRQCIQRRLPYSAEINEAPVLLPEIGWGGLRYTLMGGATFEVISLRDYCRRSELPTEMISSVLQRLLRIMDNLWSYSHLAESFPIKPAYEQLLPVNLLIYDEPPAPHEQPYLIWAGAPPQQPLEPGAYVQVRDFVVHKANPVTQTLTLKRPTAPAGESPYYLRYKSPALARPLYQAQQAIDLLQGRVVETQLSRLQAEVQRAFQATVDPAAPVISLTPWSESTLPNPLSVLPALLEQSRPVNIATIHGDFNFENILVEAETGNIGLIDFAEARADHALHDLLRMETEVLTRLVPEILYRQNLPPLPGLAALFWGLYTNAAEPAWLHPDLRRPYTLLFTIRQAARKYLFAADDVSEYYQGLIIYLLGALKFKNLDTVPEQPLPKQVAFWAAALAQEFLSLAPAGDTPSPPAALKPLLEAQWKVTLASNRPESPGLSTSTLSPAQAEERLAALPVDIIPPLAALPPQSRMPLSRNPLFVGRRQDLRWLAQALKGGHTVAIGQTGTVATTGLGGMGKTQLASEFIHRYGQFFSGGVFWLSFADPKTVPAEIAACGGAGAMELRPNFGQLPLEDQLRLVRAAWQEPIPRLLVFDNCEEPQLLAQWRPASGGCRILVTSRRAEWDPLLGVQTLPLDVLQRHESVALLREHCPDADDETLEAIAAEVGDLPLALHLAGSYMARYRRVITPTQYLQQLQDPALLKHPSLKGLGLSPTGHAQNVYRTIALSYDQLDPANPTDE